MKKIFLLLFIACSFLTHAQTSSEISAIISASQADPTITGQGSQLSLNQNIILATAGSGSYDTQSATGVSYRSWEILIVPAAGTVTAGVITFEASNDNFVSTALPVLMYDLSSQTANPVTTITLVAATPRYLGGKIPFRYLRARISTAITGTTTGVQAFTTPRIPDYQPLVMTISQAAAANLNATVTGSVSVGSMVGGTGATNATKAEDNPSASGDTGSPIWGVRRDAAIKSTSATGDYSEIAVNPYGALLTAPYATQAKTYSVSGIATLASAATDVFWFAGNATNTVAITKIRIIGIATAVGVNAITIVKRSTANTGGTSSSTTPTPHDLGDGASVSSALTTYSANPTPGTGVVFRQQYFTFGTSTSPPVESTFDFGEFAKPIILSGTAQGIAINLNGATVTGGALMVNIEFVEIP